VTRDADASILNRAMTLQVARLQDLRWLALERQLRRCWSMAVGMKQLSHTVIAGEPPVGALPFAWEQGTAF
jgi:hypothetical protein